MYHVLSETLIGFSFDLQPDRTSGTIKEQLATIAPVLDQLWKQKAERVKEFSDVQSHIQKICAEIAGSEQAGVPAVDESDLSLKKLDEFQAKLQELHKEKVLLSAHINTRMMFHDTGHLI